jgi:hypothetical protein
MLHVTVHNLMWLHGSPARHCHVKPLLNEKQKVTFNTAFMGKCDLTFSMTLLVLFSTYLSSSRMVVRMQVKLSKMCLNYFTILK